MSRTVELTYSSVEALMDVARNGRHTSHRPDTDGGFLGTASFDAAEALHRNGWTPGMDTIKSAIDRIELPDIDLRRVRLTLDVAGGAVDMGRYMANDPECMRRIVMTPSKPVVRVAVCGGFSCAHSTSKVLANGAPVVALCDLLASAGFGIEIDAVNIARGERNREDQIRTVVTIKKANEPIDLGSFAFAIAHSAFQRRMIWGAWEVECAKRDAENGTQLAKYYGCDSDYGYYGLHDCATELAAFATGQGYDIDLTGYPVDATGAVDRVVTAVRAWMARVTPDE